MRGALFSALLLAISAPAAAQLKSLVVFGQWGAFERDEPRTCYAIARADRSPRQREWKPFASVSWWPTRRVRSQVHFRLSREKRQGSAVLLKIDGRTFQLRGGRMDAWAPDARADAAIVAAMRGGVEMRVETRAPNGTRIRDVYQLRGAATAIDAAAVACAK
jgi:hypothetical protein